MAQQYFTDPPMLDSTGVQIVSAIQGLALSIKPTASDIDMGPSDTTKVSTAMSKILPVITSTTNNSGYVISAGEYFEAEGKLYKATASIPIGNAWSSSASEQSDHGAVNALNSNTVKITDRVAIDRNVSVSLADCDNITETGFYRIINTTENRPFSYGILFHLMSNSYNVQIAISVGTDKGDMYCRGYGNGAWSAWKKCN